MRVGHKCTFQKSDWSEPKDISDVNQISSSALKYEVFFLIKLILEKGIFTNQCQGPFCCLDYFNYFMSVGKTFHR